MSDDELVYQQDLLLAEQRIEKAVFNAFYEVGRELKNILDNDLHLPHYKNFASYCKERWEWNLRHAERMIAASEVYNTLEDTRPIGRVNEQVLPKSESHIRPLLRLPSDNQRVEVWERVVNKTNGNYITAKIVEDQVNLKLQELETDNSKPVIVKDQKKVNFYTVSHWEQLASEQKEIILQPTGSSKFNPTNDNIEWARWSWNPITGCLHNCPYCYARDIANRFYDHLPEIERFTPVFYPDRLSAPNNTKFPDLSEIGNEVLRMGKQNVFVCSMADMFGKWVPDDWILSILRQVENNPDWNFLLLTKFPIRMSEFEYSPNTWLGTTVDYQWSVERAEKGFRKLKQSGYKGITWLSCEPMMENLQFSSLDMFDWVVMGGASKSTQTQEFRPPFDWIINLYLQARKANCKIYFKTNLIPGMEDRIKEYPNIS